MRRARAVLPRRPNGKIDEHALHVLLFEPGGAEDHVLALHDLDARFLLMRAAADQERERDDLVDVDAHQARRRLILCDGPDGFPDPRLVDDQVETPEHEKRAGDHDGDHREVETRGGAQEEPELNFRLNLHATHLVAEAARRHGVRRVVFASFHAARVFAQRLNDARDAARESPGNGEHDQRDAEVEGVAVVRRGRVRAARRPVDADAHQRDAAGRPQ